MVRQMDRQMDGQTDRHTDERTDSPCVLQDFIPIGSASLLTLKADYKMSKKGKVTPDQVLPLGDWFYHSCLL